MLCQINCLPKRYELSALFIRPRSELSSLIQSRSKISLVVMKRRMLKSYAGMKTNTWPVVGMLRRQVLADRRLVGVHVVKRNNHKVVFEDEFWILLR